jgi:hypothetical protein
MKHKKIFTFGLLVISLLADIFFEACVSAAAPPVEKNIFPITGHWEITGGQKHKDYLDISGSNLIIDKVDGNNFTGYIEWYCNAQYQGKEYFNGVYDPLSKKLILEGYKLSDQRVIKIGPNRYGLVLSKYEAYLSNSFNLESGTSKGDTDWEAKFQNESKK